MFGVLDDLARSASDFFAPTPAATPTHTAPVPHVRNHHAAAPAPAAAPQTDAIDDLFASVGHIVGDIGRDAVDLLDVPGQIDRARARTELANRFEVVGPGFTGKHHPNTVTAEEYEQVVRLYSDIRRGAGDLEIDPGLVQQVQVGPNRVVPAQLPVDTSARTDREDWRGGVMNDIATMLQTPVGRDELGRLSANANGHHTTIGPHLTRRGQLDPTNADAEPLNDPNSRMLPNGAANVGSDVHVHMNPGDNIMRSDRNWGARGNDWMGSMRSDVTGMHELTHALYQTLGLDDVSPIHRHDAAPKDRRHHPTRGVRIDAHDHDIRAEHQATRLGRYGNAVWGENPYRFSRMQMADAPIGAVPSTPGEHDGDADMTVRDSYVGRSHHHRRRHR